MPIMNYEEWKRLTKQGALHPRSKELRQVDLALKNWGEKRDPDAFDALYAAAAAWAASKDDPYKSIRNSNGAVDKLFAALIEQKDNNKLGRQAQQTAVNNIARMNRPGGFLEEIRAGAGKMSRGELTGKFSKAGLAVVEQDGKHANVFYEGFSGGNLARAKQGWADALRCAEKAVLGMRVAAMGMASGMGGNSPEVRRYTTWFGTANRIDMTDMVRKAEAVLEAMRARTVTLVLRENQVLHLVNGNDPLDTMTDRDFSTTYGYVWGSGSAHAGSGMRVVCCNTFLTEPCQYEGPAGTIYHEITHKVLGTSDQSLAGVTTYGIRDCKALAKSDPASARNIADCWCYYAISFLKAI